MDIDLDPGEKDCRVRYMTEMMQSRDLDDFSEDINWQNLDSESTKDDGQIRNGDFVSAAWNKRLRQLVTGSGTFDSFVHTVLA